MQPLLATIPLPLPPPAAVEASVPAPRERDTDSESTADVPVADWPLSGQELKAGWADLSEGRKTVAAPISGGYRDDRGFGGGGGGGGDGDGGEVSSMVTLGSCPDEYDDGGTDSDHPMQLAPPPTILAAFGYPTADEAVAVAAAAVPDVFSESESVPGHHWDGLWDCQCWGPPGEPARADFDVRLVFGDDVSYGDPGPLMPEGRPGTDGEWCGGLLGPPAEAAE
jgi:hypothetical protein